MKPPPEPASPDGEADVFARAEAALRDRWGHPAFRPGQDEAVRAVLAGRDVLAILPTGGGKSICYQVPAVVDEGLTLVVSPLIALMEDQVAGLSARGIPAAFINSTLGPREVDQRWTDAEFGRYRLLYVAPERLQTDVFVARAARLPVTRLAVDEAHCISEWGPHFRPAYHAIAEARTLLGDPPVVAVTATATPEVRRDIVERLALRDPEVLVRGFDRPNVVWSIFKTENKAQQLARVVDGVPGSGIVYAGTRRAVERWRDWLERRGVSAAAYHAGLPAAERSRVQEAWLAGERRVIVATNAFGMGIDKPDVRFVVHVDVPGTLEGYYQEAGRAGRDGERAYAVLLYQAGDEETPAALIAEGHPTSADVQQVYQAVANLAQVPLGVLPEEPVAVDVDAVARLAKAPRARVKAAVDVLVRQGTWQQQPPRRHTAAIWFQQPPERLRRYAEGVDNRALGAFLSALLRAVHADAFTGWWDIDLRLLQRRTEVDADRLARGLDFLEQRGLLRWRPPASARRVVFAEARSRTVPVDDLAMRRARRQAEQRLSDMMRYVHSVSCRRRVLLSYFGERTAERCGACDVCLGRHGGVVITGDDEPLLRRLLTAIDAGRPRGAWTLDDAPSPQRVDGLVDWLVQEGYVRLVDPLEARFEVTDKARTFMEQWSPRS